MVSRVTGLIPMPDNFPMVLVRLSNEEISSRAIFEAPFKPLRQNQKLPIWTWLSEFRQTHFVAIRPACYMALFYALPILHNERHTVICKDGTDILLAEI